MRSSSNPTLSLESYNIQLVELIQFSVDPTLPLKNDKIEVVELMQSLANLTLPLKNDVATTQVCFTASSELSGQGVTPFTYSEPPPSYRIASFDWDSQVGPHISFYTPFQIRVY